MALAIGSPCLACAGHDRPSTPVPPLESPPAPWDRPVPGAYLSVGDAAAEPGRQQGVVLATHWRADDGSVVNRVPDGSVVAWPHPLRLPRPAPLRIWIETSRLPVMVDLRVFDGAVDAAGVPTGEFEIQRCTRPPRPEGPCQYRLDSGGIAVIHPNLTFRPTMLLVLYAEWYVPVAERSAAAKSDPTVSASWGFRVATGVEHSPRTPSG